MTEITTQKSKKEIGAMIRQHRQDRKLSMADIGEKVLGKPGKDRANSYIQRIELGQRASLKEKDVLAIVKALGLTVGEFLDIEIKDVTQGTQPKLNPLLSIHPEMQAHLDALEGVQRINNPAMIAMALKAIQGLIGQAIDDINNDK